MQRIKSDEFMLTAPRIDGIQNVARAWFISRYPV